MNKFAKFGITLAALALVVVPIVAIAATINVSIDSPANGAEVTVGESVQFTGSATAGDSSTYAFNWTWGDGTQTSSGNNNGSTQATHTYTTTGTKTVELRVVDIDGNLGTDEITINVVDDNGSTDLSISNVQVSNVTTNSAVITWTTNKPATSRVIYDTTSHSDISGESAPNYGYANSTSTSNEDPMVTSHSVTVTGLSSNTQYFFRVISTR